MPIRLVLWLYSPLLECSMLDSLYSCSRNGPPVKITWLFEFNFYFDVIIIQTSCSVFMYQLIMPGYCVSGTVGAKVLSGQKKVEMENRQIIDVKLSVQVRYQTVAQ